MVGVMCNVGGGLGWAVSPELDRWGLSPSLWPPERGLWTGFGVSGRV